MVEKTNFTKVHRSNQVRPNVTKGSDSQGVGRRLTLYMNLEMQVRCSGEIITEDDIKGRLPYSVSRGPSMTHSLL